MLIPSQKVNVDVLMSREKRRDYLNFLSLLCVWKNEPSGFGQYGIWNHYVLDISKSFSVFKTKQKASSLSISLGDRQLGPTSLTASQETYRKCSNSRVDLEELESWLLGPGAGTYTFCFFFPISHKVLTDPHKALAGDWLKERDWEFVLVRSWETLEEGCEMGRQDVLSV